RPCLATQTSAARRPPFPALARSKPSSREESFLATRPASSSCASPPGPSTRTSPRRRPSCVGPRQTSPRRSRSHDEPEPRSLRGAGGGQFGIVTSFVFRTVPAQDLTCFKLGWPNAQAAAAIELWQGWAPDAPDELAASLLITATDELDEPEVTIFGATLGPEA